MTRGMDGIAISPIDGENETGLINQAAERTKVDHPGFRRAEEQPADVHRRRQLRRRADVRRTGEGGAARGRQGRDLRRPPRAGQRRGSAARA